jgi:hypothetical protein
MKTFLLKWIETQKPSPSNMTCQYCSAGGVQHHVEVPGGPEKRAILKSR